MENSPSSANIVCVTGAATGFIGSGLVKKLLERGYVVRTTVSDTGDMNAVKHLLELQKAETNLTLLREERSFDDAIQGCVGVFHVAHPMNFESKDFENEVLIPTINGVLSIIKSCSKVKTVKRLVFSSSAGTIAFQQNRRCVYDESHWSDVDYIYQRKMTGWMHYAAKTLAEKAAWEAAKESNVDFISVIPTLVLGPFIIPTLPPSLITSFSPITGNEAHHQHMKQCQFVHIDDLCEAHVFLYEHQEAKGRYICSSHDATILDVVNMIREKWPEYNAPTEFKGIDDNLPIVSFSSKKLTDLGFEFKFSLEDMFEGAIESCREKGLLSSLLKIV